MTTGSVSRWCLATCQAEFPSLRILSFTQNSSTVLHSDHVNKTSTDSAYHHWWKKKHISWPFYIYVNTTLTVMPSIQMKISSLHNLWSVWTIRIHSLWPHLSGPPYPPQKLSSRPRERQSCSYSKKLVDHGPCWATSQWKSIWYIYTHYLYLYIYMVYIYIHIDIYIYI